jgi:hypothetical protein
MNMPRLLKTISIAPLLQQKIARTKWAVVLYLLLAPMLAWPQANTGEARFHITDPSGAAVEAPVQLISPGNGYDHTFRSNIAGHLTVRHLPYGTYQVRVKKVGFAPQMRSMEIDSALPRREKFVLRVASVKTQVQVTGSGDLLIDPDSASSVMRIGSQQIRDRLSLLPGRGVPDLVVTQPGWLYEGNAVLHPRGSEYQTQIVVDGIPLTDNRSPGFGPELEADDIDSMSIYTAGYPAEYGRKMGGVVELETRRQTDPGVHGQLTLGGGSYDTASGYGQLQDVWGANTLAGSAAGSMTSHYLNPVVPENYTNNGTTGDFSLRYARDLDAADRLGAGVRHEFSRFQIPNERVQQQAGQRQYGDNFETMGMAHYQRILSPDTLLAMAGMARDNANNLYSNPQSTPIIAFLHNWFREGYFKATLSHHHGIHELKAGVESDNTFLHENFSYQITDPDYFDPDTPKSLAFTDQRPDLEQAAFVEDVIHWNRWTVSAGLRWDHYQLLLNQNAFSPRISVGHYFPSQNLLLHVSYDRIFQTPSSENILISSSSQIDALDPNFLRLPVQPSRGNYYEGGLSQAYWNRIRLDANVYRRQMRNFADDDQLLNTGVSYPIAFDKGIIYGAEGKLTVTRLGNLSGYVSYSYMVGNVWYPVTGGLFLGTNAGDAADETTGHFPNSQDQRNTVSTRFQYQVKPRLWLAVGAAYGSGLPFEFEGTEQEALAQYGPQVISRVNFDRGRVRPQFSLNASLGADIYKKGDLTLRLQADGENLNDRLNVIDFGGLFSGNAIGPGRSGFVRLSASF